MTHTHTNPTFCFSRIKKKIDQLSEGGRTSQHTHLQQQITPTHQNSLPLLKIKKKIHLVCSSTISAGNPPPSKIRTISPTATSLQAISRNWLSRNTCTWMLFTFFFKKINCITLMNSVCGKLFQHQPQKKIRFYFR